MTTSTVPAALIVLTVSLLAGSAADAGQVAPSAADELAGLRKVGAKAYVQALDADELRYEQVLSGIEAGEGDWLGLARAMKPAADGAVAEDLDAGLAKALVSNPRGVLRLLSRDGGPSVWRVVDVCRAPIAAPGKAWLTRYKASAIGAVTAVDDPDLAERKRACLQTLNGIDLSHPPEAYE